MPSARNEPLPAPAADPAPALAWLLDWLPPEELDRGMQAREVHWRGRPVGMVVHVPRRSPPRTLVHGPLGDALGEPPDWLDGLGELAAMHAIEAALREILAEEFEAAIARRLGRSDPFRWPPPRPPASEAAWPGDGFPLEPTG